MLHFPKVLDRGSNPLPTASPYVEKDIMLASEAKVSGSSPDGDTKFMF